MKIKLSSIAEQKQKKLLEQQQKNDLIKSQYKYMEKLFVELSQKLNSQKQLFHNKQLTNNELIENLSTKKTLKNSLQLSLRESKNINIEILNSVKEKRDLFQNMCMEEEKTIVKIQENEKKIQVEKSRNERKGIIFEKSQCNIDDYEKRKKQLTKNIQQLWSQIREIQNVIEQFKIYAV